MAASGIAEIAFERAWRVYRLLNAGAGLDEERQAALEQFIPRCSAKGATDAETVVGGTHSSKAT